MKQTQMSGRSGKQAGGMMRRLLEPNRSMITQSWRSTSAGDGKFPMPPVHALRSTFPTSVKRSNMFYILSRRVLKKQEHIWFTQLVYSAKTTQLTFGWNVGRWLGGANGVGPVANPGCPISPGLYPGYPGTPKPCRFSPNSQRYTHTALSSSSQPVDGR
ncbi:hypothetical protein HUJ05_010344 [Dendroctonus ponderosae]|nr:hypothetical protein HUJ05_010344 [Dendroctonus ponderosae]